VVIVAWPTRLRSNRAESNLNLHFHAIVLDGAYVVDPACTVGFSSSAVL
jgi:hypothetical protein